MIALVSIPYTQSCTKTQPDERQQSAAAAQEKAIHTKITPWPGAIFATLEIPDQPEDTRH